jgi:hypothetical protein
MEFALLAADIFSLHNLKVDLPAQHLGLAADFVEWKLAMPIVWQKMSASSKKCLARIVPTTVIRFI